MSSDKKYGILRLHFIPRLRYTAYVVQAILYGIAASLFFSLTFVLNHTMQVSGGHWSWTASLRFVFMLPMLFVLVLKNKRYKAVFTEIKNKPLPWMLWSTIGFGFFYVPLCIAAASGPSWMVAATWQITIAAGIILTPLTGQRIPRRQLLIAGTIIAGVFLVQYRTGALSDMAHTVFALVLILIAAFSYPLGNRKMMAIAPASFSTIDRVFGMTVCSMPFWILIMAFGLFSHTKPGSSQIQQSLIVALSSGVIATLFFFTATGKVKTHPKQLAAVESTQAGEVIFTVLLGILCTGDPLPSLRQIIGLVIIVTGILLNSLDSTPRRTP
jgi:drug/metabolite transporter (DMT)-like permease